MRLGNELTRGPRLRKIAYRSHNEIPTEEALDAGFVLLDSLLRPVYANPESIKILGYPNAVSGPSSLDGIIAQKILSFVPKDIDLSQGSAVTQFRSGRRHYTCRIFALKDHWGGTEGETRIALLIERGLPGPPGNAKMQRKVPGLQEDPFSFAPEPRYYFLSRGHQEVLSCLSTLVRQRRGVGVLLAQSGMGKTALVGRLTEAVRSESDIAVLPGSFESRSDLVRAIMASFGMDCLGRELDDNLRFLEHWLTLKQQAGRVVTLICDDAQELSFETLESLFLLAKMTSDGKRLLQVILSGRHGLLEKLTSPRLEQASQDIHVYCRLAPLDESEVRSYVAHRLRIAGCDRQLFTSSALSSIALYSRGIPMNVNMLCRHSLALAATINISVVDERIVADSAYDLVLRAQPAHPWDEPVPGAGSAVRPAGLLRDRRGLRLVKKAVE